MRKHKPVNTAFLSAEAKTTQTKSSVDSAPSFSGMVVWAE